MKKINWAIIWNVVVALAVAWLIGLSVMYVLACIDDGFVDMCRNASLDDGYLFTTMAAIIITLIKPVKDAIVHQCKTALERIKKQQTKATVKK